MALYIGEQATALSAAAGGNKDSADQSWMGTDVDFDSMSFDDAVEAYNSTLKKAPITMMLKNVAEAKKLRKMVLATDTLCGTNVSVESLERIILRVAETKMHQKAFQHPRISGKGHTHLWMTRCHVLLLAIVVVNVQSLGSVPASNFCKYNF